MFITKGVLIKNDAPWGLITWFEKHFPGGADQTEVVLKLELIGDQGVYSLWLFRKLRLTGIFRSRHPNGQLREMHEYTNGNRTGKYRHYDRNGQLREEGTYINGKLHGTLYKNGVTSVYNHDLQTGVFEERHLNGELLSVRDYKNGKLYGTCLKCNSQGELTLGGNSCGTLISEKEYNYWTLTITGIILLVAYLIKY